MDKASTHEKQNEESHQSSERKSKDATEQPGKPQSAPSVLSDASVAKTQSSSNSVDTGQKEKAASETRKQSVPDAATNGASPTLTGKESTGAKSETVQSTCSAVHHATTYPQDAAAMASERPAAAVTTGTKGEQDHGHASSVAEHPDSAVPSEKNVSCIQTNRSDQSSDSSVSVPSSQVESSLVDAGRAVDRVKSGAEDVTPASSRAASGGSSTHQLTEDAKSEQSQPGAEELQQSACDNTDSGLKESSKATGGQVTQKGEPSQVCESKTGIVEPTSAPKEPSPGSTTISLTSPASNQGKPEKTPSATQNKSEQPSATDDRPKSSIPPPPVYEEPRRASSAKVDKDAVQDKEPTSNQVEKAATKSPEPVEEKILPRQASLSGITEASMPIEKPDISKPAVYVPRKGIQEEPPEGETDAYSDIQSQIEKLMEDSAKSEPDSTAPPQENHTEIEPHTASSESKEEKLEGNSVTEKSDTTQPEVKEKLDTEGSSGGEVLKTDDSAPKETNSASGAGTSDVETKKSDEQVPHETGTEPEKSDAEKSISEEKDSSKKAEASQDGPEGAEPKKSTEHAPEKELKGADPAEAPPENEKSGIAMDNKLAPSEECEGGLEVKEEVGTSTVDDRKESISKEQVSVEADTDVRSEKVALPDAQSDVEKHDTEKIILDKDSAEKENMEEEKRKDEDAKEAPSKADKESSASTLPPGDGKTEDLQSNEQVKEEAEQTASSETEKASSKEIASTEEKEVSQEEPKKADSVPSVTSSDDTAAREIDGDSKEKASLETAPSNDIEVKEEDVVLPDQDKANDLGAEETTEEKNETTETRIAKEPSEDFSKPSDVDEDVGKSEISKTETSDIQQEKSENPPEQQDTAVKEEPVCDATGASLEHETVPADTGAEKEKEEKESDTVCVENEPSKAGDDGAPHEAELQVANHTKVSEHVGVPAAEPEAEEKAPSDELEKTEEADVTTAPDEAQETGEVNAKSEELVDAEKAASEPGESASHTTEATEEKTQKEAEIREGTSEDAKPEEDVPKEPSTEEAPSEVEAASEVVSVTVATPEVAAEPPPPPPPSTETKRKPAPRSPSKRVSSKTPPRTLDKKDSTAGQDAISKGPTSPKKGVEKSSSSPKKSAPSKNGITSPSKSVAKTPGSEQKKLPPIKAPVGQAPRPDLKNVRSKIGSLDNIKHRPKGGEVKVQTQKLEWRAAPKVGSLDNASHKPGGGDKKILSQKLEFKAQPKVGSLDNVDHKPTGGQVKVETQKLEFKQKAQSKVGSLDNVKHKAGGGAVKIVSEKLDFKERASSKIGSLSTTSDVSSNRGSETQSPVQATSPAPNDDVTAVEANGHGADSDISPTKEEVSNDVAQEQPPVAATAEVAQC